MKLPINETAHRFLRHNKGTALILVYGVLAVLTAMQLQMVNRGVWQARTSDRIYDQSNALYLAEAALNQAAINLRTVSTADDITSGNLSTGSFEIDAPVNISANLTKVVGRGISQNEQRRLEGVFRLTQRSIFQFALFGDSGIIVSGSATTDGYDSSLGPYNSITNRTPNGDIGTNASTVGGVDLSGRGVYIDGQVAVGYEAAWDPYSVVTGYQPHIISGGTDPPSDHQDVVGQTEAFPMPAVTVPPGLTCNDLTVSDNTTTTLTSDGGENGDGVYCFNDLTLQGGGKLTSNGKVTVYVTGTLTAKGNSMIGYPTDPKNFLVKMTWTGDAVLAPGVLTGTTGFYGALYAPDSIINIQGNAEIFGSVIAKSVDVTGNATVHYDESLKELIDISNGFETERISWREL